MDAHPLRVRCCWRRWRPAAVDGPLQGATGAVNTENILLLTMAPGGQTATFPDGTVTRTLYRIAPQ